MDPTRCERLDRACPGIIAIVVPRRTRCPRSLRRSLALRVAPPPLSLALSALFSHSIPLDAAIPGPTRACATANLLLLLDFALGRPTMCGSTRCIDARGCVPFEGEAKTSFNSTAARRPASVRDPESGDTIDSFVSAISRSVAGHRCERVSPQSVSAGRRERPGPRFVARRGGRSAAVPR